METSEIKTHPTVTEYVIDSVRGVDDFFNSLHTIQKKNHRFFGDRDKDLGTC